MKDKIILKLYFELNKRFLNGEIDVDAYEKLFSKLYYGESKQIGSESYFNLIQELWEWIDGYEKNPKIRESHDDLLDEIQLTKKVEEYQKKIEVILNGKSKR